jgi:DNA-binding response OmpR family regulator
MKTVLKNFTLLYAEDDLEVQEQMGEYFETYFQKIYIASNGKEALALYNTHKPDVMILDIYMPDIDGLKLTEMVRVKDFKTKIVVMSAHSQSNLVLQAINSNVNHYLVKPATLEQIKDMLYKLSTELLRDKSKVIRFSETLLYNTASKELIEDGQIVELGHKTSRLLEIMVAHINKTVPTQDIISFVWEDCTQEISYDSVKSQVSILRKKLPENSLTSVYGTGYILKA